MKVKTNLTRILVLLAILIVPTRAAHAQSPSGDVVLFGQNYALAGGEKLDGSLAVFGGNIKVEVGASVSGDVALIGGNFKMDGDVKGNVAVIGGNLTVSGKVNGDIVVIGGQVQLTASAVVDGDIATIGGQLERDPKAQVHGDIVNNTVPPNVPAVPDVPNAPNVPNVPNPPHFDFFGNLVWRVFNVIGLSLLMGGLAAVLTLFIDQHIRRVAEYAVSQTLIAGSIGLLSMFVCLLLILTIVPIFIVAAAWFLGVIAIGQEVGERFTKAIHQTWAPPLAAAFGTFILVWIGGSVDVMIPCFGWLFNFIVALIGIGAVVMTRFGTRPGSGMVVPAEVPPAPSTGSAS